MRITLTLEDDAYAIAKGKAQHEDISIGKAASLLILQSVRPPPKVKSKGVFKSSGGKYTSDQVEEALADE